MGKKQYETNATSIESDFKFQKIEWPVYRVGWVLMGLFILLGLLGLFGTGVFSRITTRTNGITLEYDYFLRYSVPSELIIHTNGLGSDSSLTINGDYIKKTKIDKIVPEPESTEQNGDVLVYKFSSPHIREIKFYLTPEEYGVHKLNMKLAGKTASITQFIYF